MERPLLLPGEPTFGRSRSTVLVKWGAVAAAVVALAWLSFGRNGWVPFLSGVDLGVHEFGHLLFGWAPFLLIAAAGSALQVMAPAALAGYFWWRRDRLAVVLLFGWLGMSLNNVAVYIGDANRMVLPLFGDDGSGAGHDWHNILGELGWLAQADGLAGLVRAGSLVAFLAGVGLAGWFARCDLVPTRSELGLPIRQRSTDELPGWSAAPTGVRPGVHEHDQHDDRQWDQERP